MNVPAIAKRTFEELQHKSEFLSIVQSITEELGKMTSNISRAKFIHKLVDENNQEVFSHPLVKQLSPCKVGCSACCHTQVSVTNEEAILLANLVKSGIKIDENKLALQASAGNDSDAFYKISYESRGCVFLDEKGACRVYKNRPSVCRTNAVIGEASQCDTQGEIKPTRLVRTQMADLAIYAFFSNSEKSGTLPHMLSQAIASE